MRTKLRTQKIAIDLPRVNSEPWILITVQRVDVDDNGKEVNVVDRWGTINKRLSAVALEVYPYFEVIPGLDNALSVFAIADAIKETAIAWIVEKYGGTNINGDVFLD